MADPVEKTKTTSFLKKNEHELAQSNSTARFWNETVHELLNHMKKKSSVLFEEEEKEEEE